MATINIESALRHVNGYIRRYGEEGLNPLEDNRIRALVELHGIPYDYSLLNLADYIVFSRALASPRVYRAAMLPSTIAAVLHLMELAERSGEALQGAMTALATTVLAGGQERYLEALELTPPDLDDSHVATGATRPPVPEEGLPR